MKGRLLRMANGKLMKKAYMIAVVSNMIIDFLKALEFSKKLVNWTILTSGKFKFLKMGM